MTYQEQLKTPEWKAKRTLIMERDNFRCTKCNIERTKFLGLNESFGIKTLTEFLNAGFNIFYKNEGNRGATILKNGFVDNVSFVGDTDTQVVFEDLNFALQWQEVEGRSKLICFLDDIKESHKFADLNIHHKFYINNKKAWEYDNDALITLCESCHEEEHNTKEIFVYALAGSVLYKAPKCDRCNGSGYLPQYKYYQNGVCFGCFGHGVVLV
jgi:hypothetical protein